MLEPLNPLEDPIYVEELDGYVAYRGAMTGKLMFIKDQYYTEDPLEDMDYAKPISQIANAEFMNSGNVPKVLEILIDNE